MDTDDSKVDIIKKKKLTTLTADTLDNRAPVEKIIEFIQNKRHRSKVFELYCHTIRQRNSTLLYHTNKHYCLTGHPLNKFDEEWDGGLNSGYFERFSHRSLMPKMISKINNIERNDPVTEFMKKKLEWEDLLTRYKAMMGTVTKKRKIEWIDDDLLYGPQQLVDIAAHYEDNPDLYFDASYNWYYAGQGNMQRIYLNGDHYLLYSEFSTVYVTPFSVYDLTIEYDNVIKFDCGKDLHILETIFSQNIVALRTKHKIFILKICQPDGSIHIEKIKELDSKLPFTGITFDEFHRNILYVTTLDFKLTIVNIDRMTGRSRQLRGKVDSLIDNWSTVIGSERGYYTHVAKNAVTLYDKRTNNAFQRWKNLRNITDERHCNDISVAKHGTDKRLLYLGTDHHLFLLDLRYNKQENNKLTAVQRWTHGMQCLPTYMTINRFDYGKELITLSSQWVEDMCVVSNYSDRLNRHNDIPGVMNPYRPPNVLQVLNEAKENMLCCNLYNPIDVRLTTAITGLSVLDQDDKYHILMLNSLGDISCHTLCPLDMTAFFEDTSVELLHEWSKGYKKNQDNFEVTCVKDIRSIWKQLKRVPDDFQFGVDKFKDKVMKFNEQEIFDAFENEEIESGLLDIWMNNQNETLNKTKEESSMHLFFDENE